MALTIGASLRGTVVPEVVGDRFLRHWFLAAVAVTAERPVDFEGMGVSAGDTS